ncbi:hypothetical protein NECAME_13347 [Necator americanus]|uniref:Uncharacterized protein n=1 Tax=Necator americanus TaxID=51031 RepID=W2SVX2_NECAM|nr:hypothetical protein NECAME_13347 [Necator americanus]ETN73894.1 hypothetical protein NECAME_13347 [Necator americanus]
MQSADDQIRLAGPLTNNPNPYNIPSPAGFPPVAPTSRLAGQITREQQYSNNSAVSKESRRIYCYGIREKLLRRNSIGSRRCTYSLSPESSPIGSIVEHFGGASSSATLCCPRTRVNDREQKDKFYRKEFSEASALRKRSRKQRQYSEAETTRSSRRKHRREDHPHSISRRELIKTLNAHQANTFPVVPSDAIYGTDDNTFKVAWGAHWAVPAAGVGGTDGFSTLHFPTVGTFLNIPDDYD